MSQEDIEFEDTNNLKLDLVKNLTMMYMYQTTAIDNPKNIMTVNSKVAKGLGSSILAFKSNYF